MSYHGKSAPHQSAGGAADSFTLGGKPTQNKSRSFLRSCGFLRTRAQHIYYTTFDMHESILNMHKSFLARLWSLRIDESLRLWYSIVTERKQPEAKAKVPQKEGTKTGRIRKEGGSKSHGKLQRSHSSSADLGLLTAKVPHPKPQVVTCTTVKNAMRGNLSNR